MSLNTSFWSKKKRPAGQEELEGALAFIPQAVLVVDASQRVLAVNPPAARLFNRPRQELLNKTLNDIFDHLPDDFGLTSSPANPSEPFVGEIEPPGQPCLDVHLQVYSLSANSEYFLITLEPVTLHPAPLETPELHAQFWEGLYLLASAAEQPDLDAGLRIALAGARALLGCPVATLYLCKSNDPARNSADQPTIPLANRSAARWGEDDLLPALVGAQDLVMLR